jgi:hypothetical protein
MPRQRVTGTVSVRAEVDARRNQSERRANEQAAIAEAAVRRQ